MLVVDGVEVLDVREAAGYVGRTPETVRRWIWSGRIPSSRHGNRLLVARADLDALLAPPATTSLSLAQWTVLLPTGTGRSAADLVLADRADRER